jgi:hypothetical protein
MKTLIFPKKEAPNMELTSEGIRENLDPNQPVVNITDGGEFLDDALRMKDQPLEETPVKETNKPFLRL